MDSAKRGSAADALSLALVAVGLLLMSATGFLGRATGHPPSIVYWLASMLVFAVPARKVLSRGMPDGVRVAYTLVGAVALLVTRLLLFPTEFVYHDEMLHRNSLRLITTQHHLFIDNSVLPVTRYYPGLEAATAGVHDLAHLSLHASGVVVLVLARIVMTLALIAVYERIGGSLQTACVATTIYAANPQYVWFNAQFSYQSLSLPLCFLTAAVFATRSTSKNWRGVLAAGACAAAAVATHHLTALAFVVIVLSWLVLGKVLGKVQPGGPAFATLVLLVFVGWTVNASSLLLPYVDEIARHAWQSAVDLIHGHSDHRLFHDSAGDHTPVWERLVSLASVVAIMVLLIPSLWRSRESWRARAIAGLVLVAVAIGYPIIPVGHLTETTSEIADRSSGFIFVGLSFVLARWSFLRARADSPTQGTRKFAFQIAILLVLFVGGAVVGAGPSWLRTPGAFLVSAENRSIDPPVVATGRWVGAHLPPDSRILTDRSNALSAAVYGRAHIVTGLADHVDMDALSRVLLGGADVQEDVRQVRRDRIDFLVADRRLAKSLPHIGIYIERGEIGSHGLAPRTSPPTPAALQLFDSVSNTERIYDNGSVAIYDLRRLR